MASRRPTLQRPVNEIAHDVISAFVIGLSHGKFMPPSRNPENLTCVRI